VNCRGKILFFEVPLDFEGVHFTLEQLTPGRVLAPVVPLWVTHNQGNHGGIALTQIGEPAKVKRTLLRG